MSKITDMAKTSVTGGFHLMWGLMISTVISAIGTIIVAWTLIEAEYGLYTVALTAPTLISTFRDWGINSAMIRYSAQYKAEGKADKIRSIFISGLIFELALGLGLSILSFGLSGFLATTIFERPHIVPLIRVASFIILGGGLINGATAAFIGMEKMQHNSITLVVQALLKTILIPALVIVGLGAFGATLGYTMALLISGAVAIILMGTIYRKLPSPNRNKLEIPRNIKMMFTYGVPLSIGAIIGGFLTQFYATLMARYAVDELIGNYQVAMNFVVLITFFATPVTTMLFPAFSKLDNKKDNQALQNVFQYSIKYAALIVVPIATMIMALSQPAIATIFRERYSDAPIFLTLLAITYLFAAFGSLSITNLINSQGDTRVNMKFALLTAAIGFPMGYILISQYDIIGLIVTTIFAGIPSLVISLYWIKRNYNLSVDWVSSAKILFTSIFTATLTYSVIFQLKVPSFLQLLIGALIFIITFLLTTLLTKTITKTDINYLRQISSALGPLTILINHILNIIEKLMNILKI